MVENSAEAVERVEEAMEAACSRSDKGKDNVVKGVDKKVKEKSYLSGSKL